MKTPADLNPAVLSLELESAWQAYEDMKELAERREREAAKYRQWHFRNFPMIEAFGRICRSVSDAERSLPLETVVRDIKREVKKAQRLRDEIEKRQQEGK